MNEKSVAHASFSLEHVYDVEVDKVFGAWADPLVKASWFAPAPSRHSLDFRRGGEELVSHLMTDGGEITFRSVYHDIVPSRRIVYSSELAAGGTLSTVSITTVEFEPHGNGSRLVLTEQDAFLDGQEKPDWREQGTRDWLDRLSTTLHPSTTTPEENPR